MVPLFNGLEGLVTQISRSRHYLTLNISETVRDSYNNKDLHMPYRRPTVLVNDKSDDFDFLNADLPLLVREHGTIYLQVCIRLDLQI